MLPNTTKVGKADESAKQTYERRTNGVIALVEERRLPLKLIVTHHPLLLLTSRGLRCRDGTLDAMDMPPVLRGVSLDILLGEHR